MDFRLAVGSTILLAFTIMAIGAPWLSPSELGESDLMLRLCPPSSEHWLGCDLDGADMMTGLLYGARTSLYVGLLTVALSAALGVTLGLVSGYRGGWVDMVVMRTVDLLMAFPGILLAMTIAAVLGPSLHNVVFAISATGWTSSARIIRGQVLSIRERDFVTASRALGVQDGRILWRHIFPSTWSPLLVHATFSLSGVIIIEASLSFLGLGAQSEAQSWGALLSQGKNVLTEAPHVAIFPGLAIMIVVLALNFVGDALRDRYDPRYQS